MAIWLYSCNLIKAQNSSDIDFSIGFDLNAIDDLESILPKTVTWNKSAVMYGDENESFLELCYDEEVLAEIFIRLDLRSINSNLIHAIIDVAKDNDLIFYDIEHQRSFTSERELKYYLRNSKAAQFLSNPVDFLQNLSVIEKDKVLAYNIYPNEEGRRYYAWDLLDSNRLKIILDYCQILECTIFKAGWELLMEYYSIKELFDINKLSGWLDDSSLLSFREELDMQIECSKSIR